ncbi:MAG: FtsQ-type POTRA domain-containing protein [Clostridiaceae bacterium]|jgi:cell division protein FtsQ|nr:FtsQ-type POTRA domain-containing protein [Clostridiaceae bacterium]
MKKKGHAKTRLKIFIFIFVLALCLVFLLFAPFFNIKSIKVEGSSRYTAEKIIETSGIMIGENGFRKLRLDPEAILELRLLDSEEKIGQLPYVKSCTVKIVFPDSIIIHITEREPAAYIVYFDNYLTVDAQGYVLEAGNSEPPQGLKEIRGIDFKKYTIGGQLEESEISLIITGVEIINTINNSDKTTDIKLADVLDWVDVISENNAILSLDNRIIVRFNPKDKLQYTIDFTKEIFFKKISTKETGRIEFSGNQNPSFIPD